MTQVNIEDVQSDVTAYLKRVAGETIVILRGGKPVAEVKPISASSSTALRPFGLCKGKFTVPDDFDAPLPEDLLRAFEGK